MCIREAIDCLQDVWRYEEDLFGAMMTTIRLAVICAVFVLWFIYGGFDNYAVKSHKTYWGKVEYKKGFKYWNPSMTGGIILIKDIHAHDSLLAEQFDTFGDQSQLHKYDKVPDYFQKCIVTQCIEN